MILLVNLLSTFNLDLQYSYCYVVGKTFLGQLSAPTLQLVKANATAVCVVYLMNDVDCKCRFELILQALSVISGAITWYFVFWAGRRGREGKEKGGRELKRV